MASAENQQLAPPPPYPLGLEPHPGVAPPPDSHSPWPTPPPSVPSCTDEDMYEDHVSFLRTVNAFRSYRKQSMNLRDIRLKNFKRFQEKHRETLCIDLDRMFATYLNCIEVNSRFFESICNASSELFNTYWPMGTTVREEDVSSPTPLDIDKVFTTLRQFVRDWSAEGAPERESVYTPILTTLENSYPDYASRADVRILVPGAGLCRLSVELALRGFAAQANEFSYHMLIAGHYIQNHVVSSCQHVIYPYVDNTSNLVSREDQFAEVHLPDLCAFEAIDSLGEEEGRFFGELSMVAGDFTEVYAKEYQQKNWNAVVTCFFIDTAHNIVEYMEIIYNLLIPGGYWVNVGPLLYHFADSSNDVSIELSLEEVLRVAQRIGFVLLRQPEFIDTTYTNNHRSMKQLVYRCAFFLLQRPFTETEGKEQQQQQQQPGAGGQAVGEN